MKYSALMGGLLLAALMALGACGDKKGGGPPASSLHPPGKVIDVLTPEGNLLQTSHLYKGDWTTSQWYTFKLAPKKMETYQLLATNENPDFGKVDLKISQKGEEFYTSMTSTDPWGPQRVRLPPGEYLVTIVISVDGNAQKAGRWTLSASPIEGKESLKVPIPSMLVKRIQDAFPGSVHSLALRPDQRPEFDFIMEAFTWDATKDLVSYIKEPVPIFPFDTPLEDVMAQKGAVHKLMAGEPVIVYELMDIIAVRVYTVDGMDGIVPMSSVVKETPAMVNLPSNLRLAPPNLRNVAPWDSELQSNGGVLALLVHPLFTKKVWKGKVGKCLQKVDKAEREAFLEAFKAFAANRAPESKEDAEKAAEPALNAWGEYTGARDSCLASIWEKSADQVDTKLKTEALYVVLNKIRTLYGSDEVPIPVELPAILPQPPPPPPPPEPVQPVQPVQPGEGGEVIGPDGTPTIGPTPQPQPQPQPDPWGNPPPTNPVIPPPSGGDEVIGPSG